MPPPAANVALNKPTRQSSVYVADGPLPPGAQTAGGGNNGVRTGSFELHTMADDQPWWVVDLQAAHRLHEIRIYNRRDHPLAAARANELDVQVSADGLAWITVFSHQGLTPFGLDGRPLIVPVGQALPLRFVRLQLRSHGILHLDEVAVYGERLGAAAVGVVPPAQPAGPSRRIIHVTPRAGLANRMLQFMAAVALQDRVPGCGAKQSRPAGVGILRGRHRAPGR